MFGSAGALAAGTASAAASQGSRATWGIGYEGQRKADRGDGTFLNPIMAGDCPDPTILRDGDDYYMTFTTFESYPGLILWHSRDLVNWRAIGPAITKPMGSVLAVDLCKHNGRYYIYIPIVATSISTFSGRSRVFVIHAETIAGPWSDPIPLEITGIIDPGHVVGEDGHRYLFTNGVNRVKLTADGLAAQARRVLLHDQCSGRHRGAADESHGHRRALALDPRTPEELPAQPDRAHGGSGGKMVIARSRDRVRRACATRTARWSFQEKAPRRAIRRRSRAWSGIRRTRYRWISSSAVRQTVGCCCTSTKGSMSACRTTARA